MVTRRLGGILKGLVLSSLASGCGGAVSKDDALGAGGVAATGGNGSGGLKAALGGAPAGGSGSGGRIASGGTTSSSGGAPGVPTTPLCSENEPLYTDGFNVQEPADYVGLYLVESGSSTATLYQETGVACVRASDVEACNAKLTAAQQQTTGFPFRPVLPIPLAPARSFAFLVTVRGDTVNAIADEASLRAFVGPIDTPNEAALRYFLDGYVPACNLLMEAPDGYGETFVWLGKGCGGGPDQYFVTVHRDATLTAEVTGISQQCVGRRPAGLLPAPASTPSSDVGSYFASVARLEAAAVRAFEIMVAELQAFDAPHELVMRAKNARADEIRHAWEFGRLASAHAEALHPIAFAAHGERSLLEIALENAAEGVVRETWGALQAAWQAENVADVQLRDILGAIAEDEAEHAALSRAVDEWIQSRLDEDERVVVELEKRRALSELRRELTSYEPARSVVELAAVPDRERALDLFARFEAEFFAVSKGCVGRENAVPTLSCGMS